MTLTEIEEKFDVQDIKINDISIWPVIRIYLGDSIQFRADRTVKFSGRIFLLFIKSVFYGVSNYFKKFDYIYFTSTEQRKWIHGKYTDRGDYLNEFLNNGLCIELPMPAHLPKNKIASNQIASRFPLIVASQLVQLFVRPKWQHESLIKKILASQPQSINYKKLAKRFLADRLVMRYYLKRCQPRMIFLTAPYNAMGYVYASKELGVKVVEFQHGIINRAHYAYGISKPLERTCYPDYLLSFGSEVKKIFNNNHYINEEKVLPIGSFYIDHVADMHIDHPQFKELRNRYDRIVVVTLQDGYEEKMLPFLKSATERCADIGFLFVPRHKHAEHYQQYGLPDNVIFIHELDAYQSMAAGDIHTTLNSTCALEAPSLGTVNVLMNIDNMARKYLEKLLVENESTYYASNVDEFCELVRKVPVSDKNLMKSSNSGNIRENFKSNLKWAIDKIVND